jgi:hypothetical protein
MSQKRKENGEKNREWKGNEKLKMKSKSQDS